MNWTLSSTKFNPSWYTTTSFGKVSIAYTVKK